MGSKDKDQLPTVDTLKVGNKSHIQIVFLRHIFSPLLAPLLSFEIWQ